MKAAPLLALSLIWRSIAAFARAGAKAAIVYTCTVIPLLVLVAVAASLGTGRLDGVVAAVALLPVCLFPFGIILGVVPSVIMGALDGLLIGIVMALTLRHLTPPRAALIGVVAGAALAVVLHLMAFGQGVGDLNLEQYTFWLGAPTAIGIVVSAVTARRVFLRVVAERQGAIP
jgi:hypothetical protein